MDARTLEELTRNVVIVIRTGEIPEREDTSWDGFLQAIAEGGTKERRLGLFKEMGRGILTSQYNAILDAIAGDTDTIPRSLKIQLNNLPRTDAGNAESLVLLYGEVIRYDHEEGAWMLFGDNGIWSKVKDGAVSRLALQTVRFRGQAAEMENGDTRQAMIRFATNSESYARLGSMLKMARNMRPVAEEGGNWNLRRDLIGTPNGIVSLRDGRIIEGKPNYAITLQTNTTYHPEAMCPTWMTFLEDIFRGDNDLIDYIQLALGYSLTGETDEQILIAAIGGGANGKSTFMNAITYALGDYAQWADMSTFYHQYGNSPRNDVARLRYARLVASSEHSSSQILDEGIVKRLTGQDKITCRHLYEQLFEYYPQFCIWLLLNVLPRTKDASHAFWRRIHTVPFSRVFIGDEIDVQMNAKLRRESQGILAWIVQGAIRYYSGERLQETSAMLATKESWRRQSDHFRLFMSEMIQMDSDSSITAVEFRKVYHEWCSHDITPLPRNTIGKRLKAAYGIQIGKDADGRAVYRGIKVIQY